MNLQVKLAFEGDLAGFGDNVQKSVGRAVWIAADRMATMAKLKLREDTRAGGLGEKVANAWQQATYPGAAGKSLHPAGFVYSKAPDIVRAFAADTIIVPKIGIALAIPTADVPRRGNKQMTPVDVEALYNQDLILRPGKSPGVTLAFVKVVRAKNGRGFRQATKGRLKQGRAAELILMFVFVRQVHLQKRLNWPEIFVDMQSDWSGILGEEVERALAD